MFQTPNVSCVRFTPSLDLKRMFVVFVCSSMVSSRNVSHLAHKLLRNFARQKKPQWEQSAVLCVLFDVQGTYNKGLNCVLPGGAHVPLYTPPDQFICREICACEHASSSAFSN